MARAASILDDNDAAAAADDAAATIAGNGDDDDDDDDDDSDDEGTKVRFFGTVSAYVSRNAIRFWWLALRICRKHFPRETVRDVSVRE